MEAWSDCGDCATTFRHLEAETVCDREFLQSNRARGPDQMEFAGNGGVCSKVERNAEVSSVTFLKWPRQHTSVCQCVTLFSGSVFWSRSEFLAAARSLFCSS